MDNKDDIDRLIEIYVNPLGKVTKATTLWFSVCDGKEEEVVHQLSIGADPNSQDTSFHRSPLNVAAVKGNISVCRLLCNNKAQLDILDNNGNTPLMNSIKMNHFEISEFLCHNGANINLKNNLEETALCEAIKAENFSLVSFLLKHGANPNLPTVNHMSPLSYAAQIGVNISLNIQMCRILLENGADPNIPDIHGETSIMHAICKDLAESKQNTDFALTRQMCKYKADCNFVSRRKQDTPLGRAFEFENETLIEFLCKNGADPNIQDSAGNTILLKAASKGNLSVCKILRRAGADFNLQDKIGRNSLFMAISNQHFQVCQYLLKHGANITKIIKTKDTLIKWLLTQALEKEDLDMLGQIFKSTNVNFRYSYQGKPLIQHILNLSKKEHPLYKMLSLYNSANIGDDLNCKDLIKDDANSGFFDEEGNSALHFFCRDGKTDLAELLIQKEAKVDKRNKDGFSPLCLAAKNGHYQLCEVLMSHGANLNVPNLEDQTPLYFICRDGKNELAENFIKNGANVNAHGCLQVALEFYYTDVARTLLNFGRDVNKVRDAFKKKNCPEGDIAQ